MPCYRDTLKTLGRGTHDDESRPPANIQKGTEDSSQQPNKKLILEVDTPALVKPSDHSHSHSHVTLSQNHSITPLSVLNNKCLLFGKELETTLFNSSRSGVASTTLTLLKIIIINSELNTYLRKKTQLCKGTRKEPEEGRRRRFSFKREIILGMTQVDMIFLLREFHISLDSEKP